MATETKTHETTAPAGVESSPALTTIATVSVPAREFLHALKHACRLATGTSDNVYTPYRRIVRLACAGGQLLVEASDRYRLYQFRLAAHCDWEWNATLPQSSLDALYKRATRQSPLLITLALGYDATGARGIEVTWFGGHQQILESPVRFPAFAPVLDGLEPDGTLPFAVNPQYLRAALALCPSKTAEQGVRLRYDRTRLVVEVPGVDVACVIHGITP